MFRWSRNRSEPDIRNDCQKMLGWHLIALLEGKSHRSAYEIIPCFVAHITSSWTSIFRNTGIQFICEAKWKRQMIMNLLSWKAVRIWKVRSSDFPSFFFSVHVEFLLSHKDITDMSDWLFTLAVTQKCSMKTREGQCSSTKSDRLTLTWKIRQK